jgi:hypothetical protein
MSVVQRVRTRGGNVSCAGGLRLFVWFGASSVKVPTYAIGRLLGTFGLQL